MKVVPYLGAFVVFALIVGVAYLLIESLTKGGATKINLCTLALDNRFLPSSVVGFKLDKVEASGEQVAGYYGFGDKTLIIVLRPESVYFGEGNNSPENLKNQDIIRRAWRGEASREEVVDLGKKSGGSNFDIAEIDGVEVLIQEYVGNVEPANYMLSYTDKNSSVNLGMLYKEKPSEYREHFVAWRQAVC